MLVTPRYSSRIRLQDLCLNREAASTAAIEFNPRNKSSNPHCKACPVNVFQNDIRASNANSQLIIRGGEDTYDRVTRDLKMDGDIEGYERAMAMGDEEQNNYRLAVGAFEAGEKRKPEAGQPDNRVRKCREFELS